MTADKHMIIGELREVAASALEWAPRQEGEWLGGATAAMVAARERAGRDRALDGELPAVFVARTLQDKQGASFLGWVYEGWLFAMDMASDLLKGKREPSAWLKDQLGPRCVRVHVRGCSGPWVRVTVEFRSERTRPGPGPYRIAGARPAREEDHPRHHVMMPTQPPAHFNDCLVVVRSGEPTLLGKRFQLDFRPICIGRSSEDDIILASGSVSRHHAHLTRDEESWYVIDNRSTNGTYHNARLITRKTALSNGDRVKIGPTIFTYLSGPNVEERYSEEIYLLTILYALTGAHNRRYFFAALEHEILRCRRDQRALTVVLFDLDHFQRINEEQGHLAGDCVLMELAPLVRAHLAPGEVFARLDGVSFALLLPDRSLPYAETLAEVLRRQVSEHLFVYQTAEIPVTIHPSASLLQDSDSGAEEFLQRAREKMSPVGT